MVSIVHYNGLAPQSAGSPGAPFTKRTDVLLLDLVKSRDSEIGCYNDPIALKFDRHLGNAATEVPVRFQNDWNSLYIDPAASRLHEIWR